VSPSKGLVKGMTGDAVRDVWLLTREECQRWSLGVEVQKVSVLCPFLAHGIENSGRE
jgi:hypothetical protein